MGTGSSAESQGIRNDTPVPTQAELAQITNAILANQQQQQQAQYVPPQASVYTPPEAQIYTPPAAQVYTPPASQVAAPGITALLPQDQGAQTLAPNTFTPTPLTLSEPQASIYTPPTQQVYTPPASQVYTPEARSEPAPQDKFFTAPAQQAATETQQAAQPAAQQAPQLSAPTQQDALAALKIAERKAPFDARYDVNGDGVVDTSDYMGLQKAYLGKDPGFAFANNTFASPSKKTADDYAAEAKANQDRIAAEQKETERRQTLLADAQKINGQVNPDLVANNPNLNAQQLASLARRNYWSNESEAFSRVMSGMESGKAQLKQVETGNMDEDGNPERKLALTTGEHPGYDTLYLQPTEKPGLYQFSTRNQVAGGTIHGLVQADPKTGEYKPIEDYTKQIRYTPGQSGSFFGGLADAFGDAIGSFGDIYKSLGPIAPILGNAIAPGLGSALSAAAALDEGNTTGAILSGLSAAGAYGGDAARNALAAEVSGNADLASQYSSGLGGALAQNLPEIKTATSAAQLANALDKGNVLGAIGAGADLTGTQLPSDYKTGLAGLGLAQAIASGNAPLAATLGAQFLPQQSAAPGADVGPPAPAGISSLVPALQQAQQETTQTAQQETPADVQVAQTTELPPDTNAGLNQLIQAINNPESTASYTGTQVADLSGTTGLPSNEPTDQDLAQLGVGLPDVSPNEFPVEAPTVYPNEPTPPVNQEPPPVDQVSPVNPFDFNEFPTEVYPNEPTPPVEQEPPPVDQVSPLSPGEYVPTDDGTTGGIEDLIKTLPVSPETTEVDPNEPPPPLSPGEYVPVDDGTTGGIEDLIKTLPGSTETTDGGFEGIDMTGGGAGTTVDDMGGFEGIDMTGGGAGTTTEGTDMDELGDFEGIDMTGGGAGEPVDDLGDFEGIDMTGGGAGEPAKDDTGFEGVDMTGGGAGKTLGIFDQLSSATGLSPGLLKLLAGSLGLGGLGSLLGQQQPSAPAQTPYTGPLSNIQFNPAMYTPTTYKPYAGGGAVGEVMNNNGYTIGVGYPDHVSEQAPFGTAMAAGGIASLGGYSDGGRLLRGPGDGVSDSIPAVIGNKQPARLADGEFVIPARIVSELGNGSTEAGARQLYAMMDRIQAARRKTVGKDKVAANTKASKHLPA